MPQCAIAHRQELVSQISLALATFGVPHRIIGPTAVIKWIVRLHVEELNRTYYDPNAPVAVAGVDTLIRRQDALQHWATSVERWIIDEAHHVLITNKWGKAVSMFPDAYGLGVTATPGRADGKGLGRHADGVFDQLIEGPTMRTLIESNYLSDYRIVAPPSDVDLKGVEISQTTGDFNPNQLRKRMHRSHIVGDVVLHYKKFANGLQGITFASDVDLATTISQQFNAAGIKSEVVSAKTKDKIRVEVIRRFRRRGIQQIVNVDILGEGFDVPGIEVISFARPTESEGLYRQQFGRALRVLKGKVAAIIIDHVGNVSRHGLPDAPKVWTLDRRPRRCSTDRDPDAIPVKTCANPVCCAVYEAFYKACPFCGMVPIVGDRSRPEFVDGDLAELDQDMLRQMRGEAARIISPAGRCYDNLQGKAMLGAKANHYARQEAQRKLRDRLAFWAGVQRYRGRSDSELHKRFYFRFGMDILSAQALGRPDAEQLALKVDDDIARLGKNG